MKIKFSPPHPQSHLSIFGEVKRKIGAVCFAVSMMMLVFSCIDREEVLQLEQDTASEIKSVKQWFDINKVSLNKEGSDVRAREMSKELILPFFEKEPDWSKFSEYHFRDGRKVFEIHLKNLSGIMPKRFFEESLGKR